MKRLMLLALSMILAACVSTTPQRVATCSFNPEGEQVYADCSDGSHFQAPVQGGIAYGFDHRGNDMTAYISLTDGRYSIRR